MAQPWTKVSKEWCCYDGTKLVPQVDASILRLAHTSLLKPVFRNLMLSCGDVCLDVKPATYTLVLSSDSFWSTAKGGIGVRDTFVLQPAATTFFKINDKFYDHARAHAPPTPKHTLSPTASKRPSAFYT